MRTRKVAVSLIVAFFIFGLGGGLAQEPLKDPLTITLDTAIELALNNNPFHLAVRESEFRAQAQLREATANFFPTLNVQGSRTLDEKLMMLTFPSMVPGQPPQTVKIDFTRDYQTAFALSLPVFAGGRLISGYKQARYNLQSTREDIRQSEIETIYNVKKAFYGYLLAKEFVDVADETMSLAQKHYDNVRNLYEVGMASKFDLLRAEVQVANLKPQVIRARNALAAAELGLKTVLSLDLNQPITVKGEMSFQPVDIDQEKAVEEALANRPELKELNFQTKMAGEMVKIARGAFFPTLAISGTFNYWADQLNFKKGTWQNYYAINLVFSMPIFNGFANNARLAESKALVRQLSWSQKGLADSVKLEVKQTILNYSQARETLLSQVKNVEQAREAVRIAELNYSEGLATSLDVTTAQVALSQARTNYSQALYDCVIALAQLEKVTGKDWPSSSSN